MRRHPQWFSRQQSVNGKVKVLVLQSCPTLCDTKNCSLPDSSVYWILQARILEWVAIPFFRGLPPTPQLRNRAQGSYIWGRFFTVWATRKLTGKESTCNSGDTISILGLGRSPGEGNGSPLQYSCLKNPLDRGA